MGGMSDPDHPFGDAVDRGVPQFAAPSDIDANALAGALRPATLADDIYLGCAAGAALSRSVVSVGLGAYGDARAFAT